MLNPASRVTLGAKPHVIPGVGRGIKYLVGEPVKMTGAILGSMTQVESPCIDKVNRHVLSGLIVGRTEVKDDTIVFGKVVSDNGRMAFDDLSVKVIHADDMHSSGKLTIGATILDQEGFAEISEFKLGVFSWKEIYETKGIGVEGSLKSVSHPFLTEVFLHGSRRIRFQLDAEMPFSFSSDRLARMLMKKAQEEFIFDFCLPSKEIGQLAERQNTVISALMGV